MNTSYIYVKLKDSDTNKQITRFFSKEIIKASKLTFEESVMGKIKKDILSLMSEEEKDE